MAGKPKIAVLIDWYLPGTKAGGPVRSVYSLTELLKDTFDFYILTTNTDLGETTPYKNIETDKLISGEVNYYYFSEGKLESSNMLKVLSEIKPDLIYLNSLWSYPFSINIVRLKKSGSLKVPVLLAPRGMLSKGALGLKSFKKNSFILLAKLMGWYKNIPFHATNEQEKNEVLSVFPSVKVFLAPNINSGRLMRNTSPKSAGEIKLFYLSRVAKVKNLHFALEALKDVPSDLKVFYDIYGNLEDKDYWNVCLNLIAELPPHVRVTYQRELKFDEVQTTISKYHALYLPTLNENFGHSIVESLLCGCPVIISDQTPWNDVNTSGAGFAISLSHKRQFTDAIIELARLNQAEFSEKSKLANTYISDKINLKRVKDQYTQMFHDGIKN